MSNLYFNSGNRDFGLNDKILLKKRNKYIYLELNKDDIDSIEKHKLSFIKKVETINEEFESYEEYIKNESKEEKNIDTSKNKKNKSKIKLV